MFNLYEKQYLLQTKTAYLESQSDLISNISAENQNLQNIIRTYTMRMDGNNTYIQKLIDGTKNMQTHVNTLREDAKKICDSMELLDSKRQEIATYNTNLRIKHINLLKIELCKNDTSHFQSSVCVS